MALAATVYMSLLGRNGLRQVAELNYHKAHYAAKRLATIPGFSLKWDTPFFNEFVLHCPGPASQLNRNLLEQGILGGYELGRDYPGMQNDLLVAVTEMNTREEIDLFVDLISETEREAVHE
jgi:glycine dehydrogenase subunit 1